MGDLAQVLPIHRQRRQLTAIIWHEFARSMQIWMESIWMVLWVWSIFHARLDLSFWTLLLILGGVMWLSYGFAVGIQQIKTSLLNIRLLFFGWAAVCIWVVFKLVLYLAQSIGIFSPFTLAYTYILEKNDIPPQVWLAIVTGLIIIRAVKLAQFHVSSYSVRNSFQIGLVFLLLYGLFGINSQLPQPVLPVAVFMGISLIGLSSAKLAEMSRQRGGSRIDLKPVWLLLIMAVTVGTLLLGASLAALMHWQSTGITNVAVFILAILTTILIIPFALIGLLLTMIMIPFIRILQGIGIFQLFKLDPGSLGIESNLQPILGFQHQLPTAPIFVMTILIILLLVLGYLVGRVRRKRLAAFGANEVGSEIDHGDRIRGNGWLRRKIFTAFNQFGRRMKIPNVRNAWTAARICRIYARFLDIMRQLGTLRETSQTPLEFLPRAVLKMPEYQHEMETITNAYLLVRYGEIPEDEEKVQQVISAWQRIDRAARPLLQKRNKQAGKD